MKSFSQELRLNLAFLSLLVFAPISFGQDFNEGLEAYARGDYETALKVFKAFAEQYDVAALANLGIMYRNGQGVDKDKTMALMYWELAGEAGNDAAGDSAYSLAYFMTDEEVAKAREMGKELFGPMLAKMEEAKRKEAKEAKAEVEAERAAKAAKVAEAASISSGEVDKETFCGEVSGLTQSAVEQIGRHYGVSVSSIRLLSHGSYSYGWFECQVRIDTSKGPHMCPVSVYKTESGAYLGHNVITPMCD